MPNYVPQTNPYFVSQSLYIDFSRLPPPEVIETIQYEKLLQAYKDRVVAANPQLEAASKLEQSPLNLILQAESYGEMIVRARVNAAARAVMLPFSSGSDLDNLGAFYNVARQPLVSSPRSFLTNPEDWQSDEAYRRMIQLAPEAFSTAGSEGAYIFHALSAAPTLRDASAVRVNDRGLVRVTLMNSGSDPTPTVAQIAAVNDRLNQKAIKPLTDTVYVAPVNVIKTKISATVTLYPGPDSSLVVSDIQKALGKVRDRISLIGRDLTRSALISAINQEGVENVVLASPASDIQSDYSNCIIIESAALDIAPFRVE